MALLLDTSAYSRFKHRRHDAIEAIKNAEKILMPVITIGELHAGFERGNRRERNRAELAEFLGSKWVEVVDVTQISAERFGIIAAFLKNNGLSVPTNDIWIGAIAMEHSATVLTADKHFQHMPQVVTKLLK